MIETHASLLDVVDRMSLRNVCVVMPTFGHALALWPHLVTAVKDRHGHNGEVAVTKTAIVSKVAHHTVRLWIPYGLEPTMPLDWERNRRGFYMMTPYDRRVLPR